MELAVVETAAAEALLFSRSAAIVGSLWAWWLAAMAAAVGLWRFRSAAVSKPAALVVTSIASAKTDAASVPSINPLSVKADAGAIAAAAAAAVRKEDLVLPPGLRAAERFRPEEDCLGTPKGRFAAYFHSVAGEMEAAGRDDCEDGAAEEKVSEEGIDLEDEEEEVTMMETAVRSRRTGDLGWYRYQDRSALNGSVVRLWDEDWRSAPAPAPAIGLRRAGKPGPVRGKVEMYF